jgi:anaerobic selenocysteine-containing dehydrogenase
VLPAAGYAEVEGTTTNLESRLSTVSRKVTPPGTAQPDWVIAADLARRLGADLGLESPGKITAEIEAVAPAFAGLTHDLLASLGGRDGVLVGLPTRRGNGASPGVGDALEALVIADVAESGQEPSGTGAPRDSAADLAAQAEAARGDGPGDSAPGDGDGGSGEAEAQAGPPVGVPLPVWTIIDPPSLDAYSLRLVVTRKLYDRGTLVRSSPSLAELAEPATLRLNPHDFDRLGVAAGDDVRITSGRGHVTVPTVPDDGVPRSIALIHFDLSGGRANVLIDGNAPVTDVRVERP